MHESVINNVKRFNLAGDRRGVMCVDRELWLAMPHVSDRRRVQHSF